MHSRAYDERLAREYALTNHWDLSAKTAARKLRDRIGEQAYQEYIDSLLDSATWKQHCELIEAKLKELE